MKRRTRAKRRNQHLKADELLGKAMSRHGKNPQYSGMLGKKAIFDHPEVARAFKKLEKAIDKLPAFNKPHKWDQQSKESGYPKHYSKKHGYTKPTVYDGR